MAKYKSDQPRTVKPATYRMLISSDVIDGIYEKILHKMIVEKRYLQPTCTATALAKEIDPTPRHISAAVSLRFGMNFSQLINGYRVREALYMLADRQNADMQMAEVAARAGFASRQSFYSAFYRAYAKTPKQYQAEVRAKQAGKHKKNKHNDEH